MEACTFCKIVEGQLDSAKLWEDDQFLAILDLNPNTKGMALVITKEHFGSYAFDLPEEKYKNLMIASKKVASILEKGLSVKRVAMVMEGLGVNHTHIKLYPLHGVSKKFQEMWHEKRIFFEKYEGYISTQLGPEESLKKLKEMAENIRSKA